ncbi:hypothetical protein [Coraliomargarita akajimensis]|uniref:Uncharacterized protein n=1 Tax=Coraliomargarita akajimensis (strain DSM 45221 / IAM 15411 / JCM 23193 / KCTC 12865 / 04OKA010-24) TaxID=583355 RepID=D5EIQ9_CORAD|nr:hypothetical protein [Coraliomargarita akajimensis]ADE54308.1 hypothetical protein Caka_1288 [Coraliomargarita akajimensis DSM 45221]
MKRLKKLTGLLLFVTGFSMNTVAASPQPEQLTDENLSDLLSLAREDVRAFKEATISNALRLGPEEAEKFWPIYQAYETELASVAQQRLRVIGKYLELGASNVTDDASWDALADAAIQHKQARLALWQKYHGKLSAAVSPFRAAQFLQTESQLALLIDLSIATELPTITFANDSQTVAVPVHTRQFEMEVIATVEMVDPETREIILRGDQGKLTTIVASEEVERFDEIAAGDHVRAVYFIALAAELRAPTEAEIEAPLVILEDEAKADADETPGAAAGRVIRAVCTIEGLSRPTQSVTVKGPLGNYMDIKVLDTANLSKLTIGQTVIITYTEAMAIELEKLVIEG